MLFIVSEYSEYSPSAVSISADFAAVRFIFLDKIRLVRYEKFATMRIFLKNSALQWILYRTIRTVAD